MSNPLHVKYGDQIDYEDQMAINQAMQNKNLLQAQKKRVASALSRYSNNKQVNKLFQKYGLLKAGNNNLN